MMAVRKMRINSLWCSDPITVTCASLGVCTVGPVVCGRTGDRGYTQGIHTHHNKKYTRKRETQNRKPEYCNTIMESLARSISSRRLARHTRPTLAELLITLSALPEAIASEHDTGRLQAARVQLEQSLAQLRSREQEMGVTRAAQRDRPHITLSTKFADGGLERSIETKEVLEKDWGFTVYNPNTDCEHKPGDKQKGQSNWLRSFRENGLDKCFRTGGFVVQLQEDSNRHRSDMQVAEEEMATETRKHGLPIIGIYHSAASGDVARALALARRQWSSGRFETRAVPAEEHKLDDKDMEVLAEHFAAMGAMAQCTRLALDRNQIGDAGMIKFSEACAGGAMAQLCELYLHKNKIGDKGLKALSGALATGALAQCTRLDLDGNQIGDKGLEALSGALTTGALASLRYIYLNENQIGDTGMQAFSTALASGALASCQELYLSVNKISDAGIVALADSLSKGAMASIDYIDLDHNKATAAGKQAMRDVAKTRARGFQVELA